MFYDFRHVLILIGFIVFFFPSIEGLAQASADRPAKKVALVIGNSAYKHNSSLINPKNDAQDLADSLTSIGFDVTLKFDLSGTQMRQVLGEFAAESADSDDSIVFYAGHGIEVGGENYLIPVDAKLQSDTSAAFEAIPLSLVSNTVEHAKRLKMIILDACRNNPFIPKMTRRLGTRSVGRGLAPVEPSEGTLIAYSAEGGSVAQDGTGRNSPFTAGLLKNIQTPGLEIGWLFRKVTKDVLDSTKKQQRPFLYGSLPPVPIYFVPPEPEASTGTGKPDAPVKPGLVISSGDPKPSAKQSDRTAWESISNSTSPAIFEAYIKLFPDSLYATFAKARLQELTASATDRSQQQAKLEEEKRQQGENSRVARLADEERSIRRLAEDFVRYRFMRPRARTREYYDSLYGDRVDFHSKQSASLNFIIKDKTNFFARWPTHDYSMIEDSFHAGAITGDFLKRFPVTFRANYLLANSTKETSGIVEVDLTLTYDGNEFQIIREKSRIIDKTSRDLGSQQVSCPPKVGTWSVVSIRSNDSLNVRSGPGPGYSVIGELAYNARGISVENCNGGWCRVQHGCLSGYASLRYLNNGAASANVQPNNGFHVVGHRRSEALNVRRAPGTNARIVGTIPYNGSGIQVTGCRSWPGYRHKWCAVRYRSVSGWAYAKYLADQYGQLAN